MRLSMNQWLKTAGFAASLVAAFAMHSCSEDIDTSARYVFTEETIGSYLEKHPVYSEYVNLLRQVKISDRSESSVFQLMTARGNFTCFAPTNEAVQAYLDSLAKRGLIQAPSWEAFADSALKDSIREVIVYNSIIDGGDFTVTGERTWYETSDFPQNDNEEFSSPTLSDRKLSVKRGENPDSIYINGDVLISMTDRDIPAINGVVHQVQSVIAPQNNTLGHLLQSFIDENAKGYLVTAKVIQACGLLDTLTKSRDERYEKKYRDGQLSDLRTHPSYGKPGYLPEHRKYGYTLFTEKDEYWEGVIGKPYDQITVEDVKEYVVAQGLYPDAKTDDNYRDEDNVLNLFITYHLLPYRIPADKLIIHFNEKFYSPTNKTPTVAMQEFYVTMGRRRLLKIFESAESNGFYLNRFPVLRNGRKQNYREESCEDSKWGFRINVDSAHNAFNCMIYPIEHEMQPERLLAYDDETRDNLQRQRMRYDVAALFPEFMNNDVRGQTVTSDRNMCVGIPLDNDYKYLDDLSVADGSEFYYLMGRGNGWKNYQADEFNIVGRYEFTLRLPPVPRKGVYEIRLSTQNNSSVRGMCQVYWGEDRDRLVAQGIPLDMRLGGEWRYTSAGNFRSTVGWETDNQDDQDYNAEVDKRMRNNGFMKGSEHYIAGAPGGTGTARGDANTLRRIMVREEMDPDKVYYMKFKSVLDDINKEFYMDYIEFCAKEVYDNPDTPEDIW